MSFLSAGNFRRLARPIMQLWVEARRHRPFDLGWATLRIAPTVFHPKFFGSSLILARFVESLNLKGRRFLDMGTGSGIIGLSAARAGADVTAVDINPDAVKCAQQNAVSASVRMKCLEGDLFSSVENERFEVIAWNPPFYAKNPTDMTEAAWFAGEGYSVIRRFASELRNHLTEGGTAYVIFSEDARAAVVEPIFSASGFSVIPVHSKRWGLRETMVVFEIR